MLNSWAPLTPHTLNLHPHPNSKFNMYLYVVCMYVMKSSQSILVFLVSATLRLITLYAAVAHFAQLVIL